MVFLATHIGVWLLVAFAFGLGIGWFMWGQWVGIDMNRDFKTSSSGKEGPAGSIAVLSDSLLKTQRELEQCQQSLADAQSRMNESTIRFSASDEPAINTPFNNGNDNDRDDLKKIYGIGPVIERKLEELAITTYRQIVQMSEDEREMVSEYINYFPGRIERDGWLESARDLYRNKYGEEI